MLLRKYCEIVGVGGKTGAAAIRIHAIGVAVIVAAAVVGGVGDAGPEGIAPLCVRVKQEVGRRRGAQIGIGLYRGKCRLVAHGDARGRDTGAVGDGRVVVHAVDFRRPVGHVPRLAAVGLLVDPARIVVAAVPAIGELAGEVAAADHRVRHVGGAHRTGIVQYEHDVRCRRGGGARQRDRRERNSAGQRRKRQADLESQQQAEQALPQGRAGLHEGGRLARCGVL